MAVHKPTINEARDVHVPRGSPSTIFDRWNKKKKEPTCVGERTHARIALHKSKFDGHFAITRSALPPSSPIVLALIRMSSRL